MKLNLTAPLQGFFNLPALRQLGLMVGLAASVALGMNVVDWAQGPSYRTLYSSLSDKDTGQIIDALQKLNVPHKLEEKTGAIMVPAERVHDTRLKLALQNLPKGTDGGFEIMGEQQGFGTSQFMETARYQRALEGELARSITTLSNVQSARVHLAIPKQSAFIRNAEPPSASVLINLYPGRNLEEGQVSAIMHLVASSIPNLATERVTVIDQKGRLLTPQKTSREMALSTAQFDYARRLEESYIKRIENILTPIMGPAGVRAQVVADVDFTLTEQTQEIFNKEKPALRSEQTTEERSTSGAGAGGVPGALSNQPPAAASVAAPTDAVAPNTAEGNVKPAAGATAVPQNESSRATRNYELDKTISHTQMAPGSLRRLSVAVVLDDHQGVDENGDPVRTPLKPEELERMTTLVKDAVGFDEKRGDSVNVINVSFAPPEEVEPPPEPSFFEQPWLQSAGKQVLGGIVILLLGFGVLRPVLSALATRGAAVARLPAGEAGMAGERMSVSGPQTQARLAGSSDYETNLSTAKTLAAQDPKRVAQVVKTWVASDA
ncbi:MAG: flagellar basal-body MS-ring/collar protein FliF [Pseudomonadota bacterium]